jgi:hypothetical protein
MPKKLTADAKLSAKKLKYLYTPNIPKFKMILAAAISLTRDFTPPRFTFINTSRTLYQHAAEIGAKRGESDEQEKRFVPPSIEHVACHDHQQVLPSQWFDHKPIKQKNYWQKQ